MCEPPPPKLAYHCAQHRLQLDKGAQNSKAGAKENNVIPSTRYASPGEGLSCHVIRSNGWSDHVSKENMVALGAP